MTQHKADVADTTLAAKRAVIYLRVSSDGQVQTDYDPDGLSIAAQREAGQDKAKQLGAVVADEYSDPGRSAFQDLHKRTEFLAMLEELKRLNQHDATRIDFVIVWSLSRWARNTVDHWQTRELVRQTGARLVSITEPMAGEDTASGFLYEGMVVTYNQYQSMLTSEGVKRGLKQKASGGGTNGPAPLGYLNTVDVLPDGRRVANVSVDPDRGPYVTLAFQLYGSGEYSVSQLAKELNRLGVRSRPSKRWPSPAKLGTSVIQRMLRNRYYAGWIVWRGGTPDEQVFKGRHEALVDQDTFDRVQALLEEKRVAGERPQIHKHYLKGSVFCGHCKGRLTYAVSTGRNGGKYPYFFCMGRINGRNCPQRTNMRPELIEAAIARYYRQRPVELTPEQVAARTRAIEELVAVSQQAVAQVREAKTVLIAKLKAQQERLLLLYAEEGDSVSPDASRSTRLRLQQDIDAAGQSLAETEERLQLDTDMLRMALELAGDVAEVYATSDEATKRGYNQAFFKKLYVTPDWDEYGTCTVVEVTEAELTETYEALLADDLPQAVSHEIALIRAAKTKDDSKEPPFAGVSYFVLLADGEGFEPSVRLNAAQRFSRPPRSTTPAPIHGTTTAKPRGSAREATRRTGLSRGDWRRTRAAARPTPRPTAPGPPAVGGSAAARPARRARCLPSRPSDRSPRRPRAARARGRSPRRTSRRAPASRTGRCRADASPRPWSRPRAAPGSPRERWDRRAVRARCARPPRPRRRAR